jgi:hypothetical protein
MLFATTLNAYSLLSFQYHAVTGNAGGQNAYALSLAQHNTREFGIFVNEHLTTGRIPLTGATYSRRYLLTPDYYALTSFVQAGCGISSAGPLFALTWNLTALQVVRLDITTHIYFPQLRPLVWSYPLWLGITVPV